MDELSCQHAGSFGLLKSTTHRSPIPISDFDGLDPKWYSNLYSGAVLHVCPQALPAFVQKVLPNITVPFKLLTNNSDKTLPDDFSSEAAQILSNPMLSRWFAQNWVGAHEKVTRIPIGLDYHSLMPSGRKKFAWSPAETHRWGVKKYPIEQEQYLLSLKSSSKPFWERQPKAYANFQFVMWTRYGKVDRQDALNTVPKHLVFYQPQHASRDVCWKHMTEHAFVLSPYGNGLDCHRTWEALALGCIPIVKSSGLDPLFEDLPVWIVHEWSEVTREAMDHVINAFKTQTFRYEKLQLAYWQNLLRTT